MLVGKSGEDSAGRVTLLAWRVNSAVSMASIAFLNGSSFGEQRTGTFLGGGCACANAIRTAARPT